MKSGSYSSRVGLAGIVCFGLLVAVLYAAREKPTRYLIVHGDDAGMSHSANLGTIEGMEKGIVSSASIMVPCPWFSEIAAYAKKNPDKDFGVHLTLNSEWEHYRWAPVAPSDQVPSLIDKDGFLWKNTALVAEHAKTDEVEIELRAQIDKARQFGVPITHIDTHMGALGTRADLLDLYVKMGVEYNLPILFSRTMEPQLVSNYPVMAEKLEEVVMALTENGFPVVDQLPIVPAPNDYEERKAAYLQTLRNLKPGVTEIIVHCGVDNAELRSITPRWYNRDQDRRVFIDPGVIAETNKLGIKVIGWKQFREMRDRGEL